MKIQTLKFMIFSASIVLSSIVFIVVGSEIIVQLAMIILGVSDKNLIPEDAGIGMITVYGLIPEVIFGSITGWYIADWLCNKIWNY